LRAALGYTGIEAQEIDGDDPAISYMERKDAVINLKEMPAIPGH
jgi:hypothetical protein